VSGEPLVIVNGEQSTGYISDIPVVQCHGDREYCYTLWHIDPSDKNKITVLMQGCWDHPDDAECPEPSCVARSPLIRQNIRNNTRFCCCHGSLCNVNVTDSVNLTAIDILSKQREFTVTAYSDPNYGLRTVVTALSSVGAVAVLVLIIFTVVRVYMMRHRAADCDELGCESSAAFLASSDSASATSGSDLDGLKIDVAISHGRYGDVYHGWLGASEVAVKILNVAQYRCFTNEYQVLTLPLMHHANIVEFRGCRDETLSGGERRLMIVTTYEPLGSLTEFLKHKTVDWMTLCRMCHSTAAGLAHLHTEFYDAEMIKPTVAHRDVNSRNILVKSDLSCCLCDFGFAMKIATSRVTEAGANDDRASLADVGTLRYMAPEVLEGSVNLCDCRMALTHVDVYALGLVFWEIGTRCHDLYQGLPAPVYQLPFEAEVGVHVSFEEMQVAVSRNKVRPTFPDLWKDTNMAIKALKDTIEECWDHDAEARISAVCAEERTREMPSLWESRFKGLTPTAHLKELDEKVQNNVTDDPDCGLVIDTNIAAAVSRSNLEVSKADCNIDLERSGAVAPPLTARNAQNPTVERNTHRNSSEELTVEGNTLVARRSMPASKPTAPTASSAAAAAAGPTADVLSSRSLTANRPLSALRPDQRQRIAYVQNDVNEQSTSTEPKRQNVALVKHTTSRQDEAGVALPVNGVGLAGRPCEVLYSEDGGATVTRPTSLRLEMNIAPSNLLRGNAGTQAGVVQTDDKLANTQVKTQLAHSSSTANSLAAQTDAADNLGYEASTSPRFDASVPAPCAV